jgi:hypothetical protein
LDLIRRLTKGVEIEFTDGRFFARGISGEDAERIVRELASKGSDQPEEQGAEE